MRIPLVLAVLGGALLFFGNKERSLASTAKAEPQVLTCAELADNGPGDNTHITLADFEMLMWDSVQLVEEGGSSSEVKEVWVATVPLDPNYDPEFRQALEHWFATEDPSTEPPLPETFKVLAKFDDPESWEWVEEVAMRDEVTGLLINEIEEVGEEVAPLITEFYPDLDLDSCYIFEVGREPAGAGKVYGMMGGGLLLLLLGIGVAVKMVKS